jgi:hypothetical protein
MIAELELLVWGVGIGLGYLVRYLNPEQVIIYLVGCGIALGTLAAGLSGELFDDMLLLPFDVVQGFAAALFGYYGLPLLARTSS